MEKNTLKLVVFVQGKRGANVLYHLQRQALHEIVGVVSDESVPSSYYHGEVSFHGLDVCHLKGKSPNDSSVISWLEKRQGDVFILAGCRHILQQEVLSLAKCGTIGLHSGKLPEFRGSSPLNWALIRGCFAYFLSVMEVTLQIDGGRIIEESMQAIGINDTIRDLHERAVAIFPEMVVAALEKISSGSFQFQQSNLERNTWSLRAIQSDNTHSNRYLPRRFPEDGRIDWQAMTAWQVHNMVRALTEPYPCAYTSFQGKTWRLTASKLSIQEYIGREGRIYAIRKGWILVGAKDKCLWLQPEESLLGNVSRYTIFD